MEQLALILLAAGDSRRFRGNKLLYHLDGKPMYRYMMEQIDRLPPELFAEKIVVTQYAPIMEAFGAAGYRVVENRESSLGISHSIYLGMTALVQKECAVCFAVCDQPYLKAETIIALAKGFHESGRGLGCLSYQGELGNPVMFASKYGEELLALNGDAGGKHVLRRHMDDLYLYEVLDGRELRDVDVREELEDL